jgi:ABC-type phosphate/phosphonate transport system ATPase subunit
MLQYLQLKYGPAQGRTPLNFIPGSMTVFVGPNNSGKSLILREIDEYIQTNAQNQRLIVESLAPPRLTRDKLKEILSSRRDNTPIVPPLPEELMVVNLVATAACLR